MLKFIPYFLFSVYVLILAFGLKEDFQTEMQTNYHMPYLADKPIGEDAYYMLTISKNLALGDGFVYNFKKETTGIQPLATIIYAIIYKISSIISLSEWTTLRLIILFNASLLILFSVTLLKVAETINQKPKFIYTTIPILILFNFGLFRTFTYGLETGLYILLFSITIYYTLKIDLKSMQFSQMMVLSLLIGTTVLARIDFIVVVLIFFSIQLFAKTISIKNIIKIGVLSSLPILPWFIYVYNITGSFIPSSGSAQSEFTTIQSLFTRILAMFIAIIENFTPWIYTGARNSIVLVALVSLIILLIIFRKTIGYTFNYVARLNLRNVLYSWIISTLALILIYTIFFWATHFYYRYSSPISIFIILFMGIVVSNYFEKKIIY